MEYEKQFILSAQRSICVHEKEYAKNRHNTLDLDLALCILAIAGKIYQARLGFIVIHSISKSESS
jgi:hypothetical protein